MKRPAKCHDCDRRATRNVSLHGTQAAWAWMCASCALRWVVSVTGVHFFHDMPQRTHGEMHDLKRALSTEWAPYESREAT